MSAKADFRLINTSLLEDLVLNSEIKIEKKFFSKKIIDNYFDYLDANTELILDFKWSGYVFANLLVILKERKGIDLINNKYDNISNSIVEKRNQTLIILSYEQKEKYLDKLSIENFNIEELVQFNIEFSEEDDQELAKAELDGILALRKCLELLENDTHVILLNVY